MHPIISAALAADHHAQLLRRAAADERARQTRPPRPRRREPLRRAVTIPFSAFHGWLARGYL